MFKLPNGACSPCLGMRGKHTCILIPVDTYTCTYQYLYIPILYIPIPAHTYTCTYLHIPVHTYTFAYLCIPLQTYTCTHRTYTFDVHLDSHIHTCKQTM